MDTLKSNDSLSLGAKSASQPSDLNWQCHGCASLDSKLHQFGNYFQSEMDILKERFSTFAASPNFLSSQGGNSVDANLLKENQDLKRRLSEIETKYENFSNEDKSLVTALLLLNNEFPASHKGSNLHPPHSKGVEAIKRLDSRAWAVETPSTLQNTIIKRWGKFISNLLTNCLQGRSWQQQWRTPI